MNAGTLEIQLLANVARLQADMTHAKGVVGSAMQGIQDAAATAARVLGTIGVGLSIAGIIAVTKASVDAMARFKDLGQEAGTTAAAISKFEAPARMAGSSLESVAAAMFRMSKAALEARDPSSRAAQALNAIGISSAQLKGLKPDEMFELVARSIGKYSDGLTKNNIMQELVGKSGREQNRVMAEIAQSGKLVATVTDEQAEAADRLQDQMVKMKMNSEEFWRSLATKGLPALNDMAEAFIRGTKEGNLYEGMIAAVSAAFDRLFGKTPQLQLELVNQEIETHKKSVKDLDALWAKLGMKINPEGQLAQAKAYNELLQKRALLEHQIHVADIKAQDEKAIRGQKGGKPDPRFDPAAAAKAAADAKRYWENFRKLEGEQEMLLLDEQGKFVSAYIENMARLRRDAQQSEVDEINARGDLLDALKDSVEALKQENAQLGLTDEQRKLYILGLQREKALKRADDADVEQINRYHDEAEALVRIGAARQEQLDTWNQIGDAAGNFFSDLITNGKSAFDNLKKMAKDLLAQMIALFAKRWILNMVGGGSMGSAGSAAGSMLEGGSSLLSGASSLSSLGSVGTAGAWLGGATGLMTGGAAYAAAVPGLTAFGAGSQAAMLAAQTGAFGAAGTAATAAAGAGATGVGAASGAMAGVYSALAAIPVWGWIAMAVIAIGAYIAGSHKGGPKGGGSFIGEFGAGGEMGRSQFGERLYTPSGADPLMRQLVEGTSAGYMQALRSMGGTTGGMTFGLGMDTDPQGTAPNRITSLVRDAMGETVFSTLNRDIGRDEENIGPEMQLETQRMILAALKASELPAAVAEVLNGLVASTATGEEITAAIQAAQTVYSIIQALGEIGMAGLDINSLKAMQLQGESLTDTFNALVAAQANYYDLFFSEEEKKLRLQDELLAQFQLMGVVMPQTREGFRALIESLDLSTVGGARLYRALLEMAPAFAQLVPTLAAVSSIVATIPPSRYGPYGPTEMELYYMPEAVAARAELARLAEALKDARQGLRDWLDSLLLNESLSPLTPMQQLEEARAQYQKTLALAQGGDLGAMGQIQGSSETYLRIAREIFASSSAYNDIFRDVFASVGGVAGMTPADVNTRLAAALPQNSPLASRADMQEINTNILTLITVIASGLSVNDPENKALLEELNANLRRTTNSGVLA